MNKLFTGGTEKVKYGDSFYYITKNKKIYSCLEEGEKFEVAMFSLGNYYEDYDKAKEVVQSILTEAQEMALPDIDNGDSDISTMDVF